MSLVWKKYHIVIYGATGYTGKNTVEYVAKKYGVNKEVRWAIAGRNRARLEILRDELEEEVPEVKDLQIIAADSNDLESIQNMLQRTEAVLSLVGPYSKYGKKLVKQCALSGVHYCDITGEPSFVRWSIDNCGELAKKSGARIVHSCGFDSVPSDMGTFMMVDHIKNKYKTDTAKVTAVVKKISGGVSGGTVASIFSEVRGGRGKEDKQSQQDEQSQQGGKKEKSSLFAGLNPYGLLPRDAQFGKDRSEQLGPRYDNDLKSWTAPFFMSIANGKIVRWSGHTNKYSPEFSYTECIATGPGPIGFIKAFGTSLILALICICAFIPPMERLAKKILPPGKGPTKEQLAKGHYTFVYIAEAAKQSSNGNGGQNKIKAIGTLRGSQDPGYADTPVMLVEAGLTLTLDKEKLTSKAGVGSPATTLGKVYLERLNKSNIVFSVQS